MCCCPLVHLLDEVGKAGRMERLGVRSRLRPLKMKDWYVVRGRGETKPSMRTVGSLTLPPSITNQADTSPSNEQGPRLSGQLFISSQLGGRERRGVETSSNPTILPPSTVIFVAAVPPSTQLNVSPSLVWTHCDFKRHTWVATHSSGNPALALGY